MEYYSVLKRNELWLSWLECCPAHQKVMSSNPGQGACLGCTSDPCLEHTWEETYWCFSLTSIFLSLSLLPSLNSKIKRHILGWRLKKKKKSYEAMKRHGRNLNACKWKKPIWKGYILYDSNHTTFWKRQRYQISKKVSDCHGLGKEDGRTVGTGDFRSLLW